MGFLKGLLSVFSIFSGLMAFFKKRENIQQGHQEERLEANAEVLEDVKKANEAVANASADPEHTERLRNRFGRPNSK